MRLISYFLPNAPIVMIYMLQQVEYSSWRFLKWFSHIPNLLKVRKRQQLEPTARAKITVLISYLTWVLLIGIGIVGVATTSRLFAIIILFSPILLGVCLGLFNSTFARLIVRPIEAKEILFAKNKLQSMNSVKIAVLGSYGKTSMKEILATILSKGKKVGVTPGNKNVLISHARWVTKQLGGDEEVLIFEYGEAEPGDILRLAAFSEPVLAVLTGLAPAHMEGYGTLDAVAGDFASISNYVKDEALFINAESPELKQRINVGQMYSSKAIGDWEVSNITVSISGTEFTMKRKDRTLKLKSQLLGWHNIGPLAAAVEIADKLGLTDAQIKEGVGDTRPFEHRLKPYALGGATIIDDTYNGNIEGMKAGLKLLAGLEAKRKTYVTPGLVEQGDLTEQVHIELGEVIAKANPDKVVLMRNSATAFIIQGLETGSFGGEVRIEPNPIDFYTNLDKFVAVGDLVMLQNDWTDNYI